MNDHDEHELTPSERATRDAVRSLARAEADDAFRARLRHEFISGRIARSAGRAAPRPGFVRGGVWAPLAAGFAIVALLLANRGPDWRVISADGQGQVLVDGVAFTPADRAGLAAHLRRGGHVETRGAVSLDLVAPGVAAVALAPNADVQLSAAPARWWRRDMSARIVNGDAYFSTGRAFHGAQLDVRTPNASVRAVGTSFAVLSEPEGTCVCVMEGRVMVGSRNDAPGAGVEVPQGMRRVVRADQVAETLPILDGSVHRLHRQLATVGGVLGR